MFGCRSLIPAILLATTLGAHGLELTPRQAEGPYYPVRKPAETDADLTRVGSGPQAAGDVLVLNGAVVDGEGKPVSGARVEIWQTDAKGVYMHPDDPNSKRRDQAFQSYGETVTDAAGAFSFRTIMPSVYGGRARHIHAKITPPGAQTLTTQFYFKGDEQLRRDFLAARAGRDLDRLLLDPKPAAGILEAKITIVVARGRAG
jgi:protocatechuate 3,4-dioxygenase beta subunit